MKVLKRTGLGSDVLFTIAVSAIVLAYYFVNHALRYYDGLTLDKREWSFFVSLPFIWLYPVALGLVLVQIVRALILHVRFGIRRLLVRTLLVGCSVYTFFLVPFLIESGYVVFTKGLLEGMKREADIPAIQAWLDSVNLDDVVESNKNGATLRLDESEWPDPIKKLSLSYVIIKTSTKGKRFVRIMGGGSLFGRWGLVVGVSSEEIPLNDYFTSEYRRELSSNAFVWYGLKHTRDD